MPTLTVHPEILALREKRRALLFALAEIIEEHRAIREEINPKILSRYDELFRSTEILIQQKTLAERELARRAELFALKIQRGEHLTEKTVDLVNKLVDNEFRTMRERMAEAFTMDKSERNRVRAERLAQADAEEMPILYRKIVKKLHPDAPEHDSEDFKKFWEEAQTAYKERNIHRLRSIEELLAGAESEEEFTTEESLKEEIHRIEKRVSEEQKKVRELQENEPFLLKDLVENNAWILSHSRELALQLEQIEAEIGRLETLLGTLLGKNWDKTRSIDRKSEENFFGDFMDSTYFNRR